MDVMKTVTERIIAQLEKGIIPWKQPWFGKEGCISGVSGKPYSLINQCLLGRPGEWYTFKQVNDLGGKVKQGEKATPVMFYKYYEEDTGKKDEKDEPVIKKKFVARMYYLFHLDQTEGVESKFNPTFEVDTSDDDETDALIYDYIDREHIILDVQKGNAPCYVSEKDVIICPEVASFKNTESYFSEMFHLLVASTAKETRLNREVDDVKEKLVCELGAAQMCNIMGLETDETLLNSTAYIQKWINALSNDKNLIVSAASKAEKAVNYILDVA